ncbi:BlaI/MecI/CopY family transcriptional regulator, partial [Candidatus Peregrinibacteria bacterium]|nr:BlaI/MecI/CopY family transcriptional regulator [Candidatus Peregrinibacteria bacterium]
MNYLSQQLVQLGLSNLESQVYLALLKRKSTTAGALAKYSRLKRSTVYTVLDSLIEKGLVNQTQIDAVKHYQGESPNRLLDFIKKEEEAIKSKKDLYIELESDLS